MAVTISDILKFPCMRGATVLGGRGGLQKTVGTISVLEYTNPDSIQAELFNKIEFVGSELVLTCFAGVKDDIDAQCAVISRIAEVGEVGIILYYVGVILPKVDRRLTEVADSLDFPLICMPENLQNLRYSEVISEVMEAIIKDQMAETDFQSEIMGRLAALPVYQRSIGTVLAMLSSRVKMTLLLTDTDGNLLNRAYWPHNIEPDTESFIACCRAGKYGELEAARIYARREYIDTITGSHVEVLLLKYDEAIQDSVARQITETVKIHLNLWSQSYGDHVLPELVQAILKDEPFKMRRIADAFKIDVKSINTMLIVSPAEETAKTMEYRRIADTILTLVKRELSPHCKAMVADAYEGDVVAFISTPVNCNMSALAGTLAETINDAGMAATITVCLNLRDTTQVRRTYLMRQASAEMAGYIYPGKRLFTSQDIEFADNIRHLLLRGEDSVKNSTAVLDALYDGARLNTELCDTLSVYLLDTDSSLEDCARKMFLHLNTIKYRVSRINERLQFKIGRMPETFSVYIAVAVKRVLQATAAKKEAK
ncbi:MAG: PucR family transcriptional regulator ligand-binding domain-containing protein [Clostridium sp.]|jgi:sugar diacid utilization regulator|nr:PucR family transcriptional regulator ligand-binding domain-containing protein [Clostridium sp.]